MKREWLTKLFPTILLSLLLSWLPSIGLTANDKSATISTLLSDLQSTNNAPSSHYISEEKPTLINLWASWCPNCLADLAETESWINDPDFNNVNLITLVSPSMLSEKSLPDFKEWYSAQEYPNLPVLLDPSGKIVKSLKIDGYPSWAMLDKDGKLKQIIKGNINKTQALTLIKNPNADLTTTTFYQPKEEQKSTAKNIKTIYLAGGCFWGVEAYFERINGVIDAISGYANGRTENPSYEDVIYRNTGHAETVKVDYDADKLSLNQILQYYFRVIDPTSLNRQGNDRGTQYRVGVYSKNADDAVIVAAALKELQNKYKRPIVVENVALTHFYEAEEYHQDYLRKNPNGYCHIDLKMADKPL